MKVGFATKSISPDYENQKQPLQIAGYSPRKLCSGIHDDLFARFVYFEGDPDNIDSHVLMVCCDLISIQKKMAYAIKRRISKLIPIREDHIMFSATHTHHGTDFNGIFRPGEGVKVLRGYLFPRPNSFELLKWAKTMVKGSVEAYNNRVGSLMGTAQAEIPEEDRVMINRRDPLNPETAQYPVSVIKIVHKNDASNTPHGIIVNYACHGTVLPRNNTLMTADYVGYLVKSLEKEYPQCKGKIVYFNGPCGEINPLSLELKKKINKATKREDLLDEDIYEQSGTWEDADRVGSTIAKYASKALKQIPINECKEFSNFSMVQQTIRIPIKDYKYGSDLKSAIRGLMYVLKKKLFSAFVKIDVLKSNILLDVFTLHLGYIETIIQKIEIGPCTVLTVPGEYFLELANEVLDFSKPKFSTQVNFIIELANEAVGYMPTIDAYIKGGYESAFSLSPMIGRIVTMKLKKLALQ